MHLGNVDFMIHDDRCYPLGESNHSLEMVANLLRVPREALEEAICLRRLHVGDKVIIQMQTVQQVCRFINKKTFNKCIISC